MLKLSAVLLAAGAGSRLGDRPKGLLVLQGVPLIAGRVAALQAAGISEVVVVLGHHADALEAALAGTAVRWIRKTDPHTSQADSLRAGLAAVSDASAAVMIALSDQPLVGAAEVGALCAAWQAAGDADMLVPRVDGKPGNPVVISPWLRAHWLGPGAALAGRPWREAHPDRIAWFDSDAAAWRCDIDTPEDLERFTRLTGQTLSWPEDLR